MKAREAKEIARKWIDEEAAKIPGFLGALFLGSINFASDDQDWPATSDIDIAVWVDSDARLQKKVPHRGLILEPSTFPHERFDRPPEEILGDFRYACHFARPSVISDPTGRLTALQKAVARDYARRKWVHRRCERARYRVVEEALGGQMAAAILTDTLWDHVFELYYAVCVTAQILALADLRNPTVRKSLVVSREVLESQDRLDIQESLLQILGSSQMTGKQVTGHLEACERAYERATEVFRTPFFFDNFMHKDMRPIAIGGSREIMDFGLYREAVFWIHWIYSLSQKVIQNDAADEEKPRCLERYVQSLAELGLATQVEVRRRGETLKALVPEVMRVAEDVMDRKPEITD